VYIRYWIWPSLLWAVADVSEVNPYFRKRNASVFNVLIKMRFEIKIKALSKKYNMALKTVTKWNLLNLLFSRHWAVVLISENVRAATEKVAKLQSQPQCYFTVIFHALSQSKHRMLIIVLGQSCIKPNLHGLLGTYSYTPHYEIMLKFLNTVEPPVATTSRKQRLLSDQSPKIIKFSKSNHYIWNLL